MAPLTPILTPALIAAIRKQPNLPRNTWYFVAAATLSALNRPDEMPTIFSDAVKVYPDAQKGSAGITDTLAKEEQLNIATRLREALIKASAVGGIPKVPWYQVHRGKRNTSDRVPDYKLSLSTQDCNTGRSS